MILRRTTSLFLWIVSATFLVQECHGQEAESFAPSSAPPINLTARIDPPTQAPTTFADTPAPVTPAPISPAPSLAIIDDGPETLRPTTTPAASVPTMTMTLVPTKSPTAGPTKAPTISPSSMPTMAARVPVVGSVALEFLSTSSLLIGDSESIFLATTKAFLLEKLPAYGDLDMIQIRILRQSRQSRQRLNRDRTRQLQEGALYVELAVGAQRKLLSGGRVPFDLDRTLLKIFSLHQAEYIQGLKDSNDPYFVVISSMSVVRDDTPPPFASPTRAPVGWKPDNLEGETPEDDAGDGLGTSAIIGIAVGGVIVLVLVGLLVMKYTHEKDETDAQTFSSGPALSGDHNAPAKSRLRNYRQQKKQSQGSATGNGSNVSDGNSSGNGNGNVAESNSDLESQGMYSYKDSESYMMHRDNSIVGADTMSYAYSLDNGIEPSVVSENDFPKSNHKVPTEIPQLQKTKPVSSATEMGFETGFDGPHLSLAESDLRLTESELAMLPSNLRSSTSEELGVSMTTREVVAPQGKLGIVIDTTVEGPVVHHVNESSALRGKVFPGDVIVAIDNVDTRAMSASAITHLMVKTANQQRRLTVMGVEP